MKTTIRLLAFLVFSTPLHAHEAPLPPAIEVTGEGELKAVPDQVVLRLGIETFGPKLKEVQSENAKRTQDLLNALKSRGVRSGDIQTEYLQINPRYDFSDKGGRRKFVEYFARKNFVVTLNDIANYGPALEAAFEAGVDQVDGLEFQSSRIKTLRDEARKLAVQDAKRRADLLAGTLGQSAGKAIRIQETGSEMPQPVFMRHQAMGFAKSADMVQDAVAPGELTVKSSVFVQFELK